MANQPPGGGSLEICDYNRLQPLSGSRGSVPLEEMVVLEGGTSDITSHWGPLPQISMPPPPPPAGISQPKAGNLDWGQTKNLGPGPLGDLGSRDGAAASPTSVGRDGIPGKHS